MADKPANEELSHTDALKYSQVKAFLLCDGTVPEAQVRAATSKGALVWLASEYRVSLRNCGAGDTKLPRTRGMWNKLVKPRMQELLRLNLEAGYVELPAEDDSSEKNSLAQKITRAVCFMACCAPAASVLLPVTQNIVACLSLLPIFDLLTDIATLVQYMAKNEVVNEELNLGGFGMVGYSMILIVILVANCLVAETRTLDLCSRALTGVLESRGEKGASARSTRRSRRARPCGTSPSCTRRSRSICSGTSCCKTTTCPLPIGRQRPHPWQFLRALLHRRRRRRDSRE